MPAKALFIWFKEDIIMNGIKVIDFFKHRYVYFAISIAIILAGIVCAFTMGVKLDIDFQGGSILKYTYTGTVDSEDAGRLLQDALGKTVSCQGQTTVNKDTQMLIINLADNTTLNSDDQQTITDTLAKAYPDSQLALYSSQSVEPFTGARFFRQGIMAIVIALILILLYVAIRFTKIGGMAAGVTAIIALFHDALIISAAYIFFQIPLNNYFIAAVLTIIGFSINDTVVIYDRIRENRGLMGQKSSADELVNLSITQSFVRSINTNVTVFLAITIVYIFAVIYNIESIEHFALPMMIGTISGAYSTICIAGPLWTMWEMRGSKPGLKKA
jgi:preprotein translocase subunit SecF